MTVTECIDRIGCTNTNSKLPYMELNGIKPAFFQGGIIPLLVVLNSGRVPVSLRRTLFFLGKGRYHGIGTVAGLPVDKS